MKFEEELTRIIGLAKITEYSVTFESVTYTIAVRECLLETPGYVKEIEDYEINMTIPFNEKVKLTHWFQNPAFIPMQESWQSGEKDCYFEHRSDEKSALMTINGVVVTIPVKS